MYRIILFFVSLLATVPLYAYRYGEHKEIGDQAFRRFILALQRRHPAIPLADYLRIRQDAADSSYYFTELSVQGGNRVGYGVLNALSGDHESNPLLLEEQLRYRSSVMQRIVSLHNEYMAMGYPAAPDGRLTKLDVSYALQAAVNISHFYEYNRTFHEQLRHFSKALVRQCENPSMVKAVFRKIGKTNALNVYVTLHTLAINLAEQGGRLAAAGNNEDAARLLFYAFLFNSFADHFLEDAFASGHLVVNRTVMASVTNNKALHDFYCATGSTVVNRKGEIWYAYGDGEFNHSHQGWESRSSLRDIRYAAYTAESERVITAVELSLEDIGNAFERACTNAGYQPFFNTIPDAPKQQAAFLVKAFPCLQLVPIPYNSDLDVLFNDPASITTAMRKANQPLAYRNFVRSRIANSLVIGINKESFSKEFMSGFDVRFNIGNFARRYAYNSRGGKRGTLDYWLGYTVCYSHGRLAYTDKMSRTGTVQQAKVGIRGNLDYWVGEKRFLGIYGYAETGAQFAAGRPAFIVVPSLGLQLGSLLNINYYNMPVWLRLPAQYLLPLKIRYGCVVANHEVPAYFSGFDLDIFF